MKELFESSYLSVMSEENDRLRKENERIRTELNGKESIIKKIKEYIEKELGNINTNENIIAKGICLKIKEIIGSDKE